LGFVAGGRTGDNVEVEGSLEDRCVRDRVDVLKGEEEQRLFESEENASR